MRRIFTKAPVLALLITLGLSACSNNRNDLDSLTLVKSIFSQQRKITPSDPQVVARSLTRAMANSDGPLALLHLKRTQTTTVLRQIETNGAYRNLPLSSLRQRLDLYLP